MMNIIEETLFGVQTTKSERLKQLKECSKLQVLKRRKIKQEIELLTALELCLLNKTHSKHTSKTCDKKPKKRSGTPLNRNDHYYDHYWRD